MKKISKSYIFHKKLLHEQTLHMIDEWGSADDKKHHYDIQFKIYRCYSLSGISYSVEYPDGFSNRKKLFDAIGDAVDHILHESPNYYRLKETLWNKGLWNKL